MHEKFEPLPLPPSVALEMSMNILTLPWPPLPYYLTAPLDLPMGHTCVLAFFCLFVFFCCQGGNVHVYRATPKQIAVGSKGKTQAPCRFFARVASEIVGKGKRYIMEQV